MPDKTTPQPPALLNAAPTKLISFPKLEVVWVRSENIILINVQ